MLACAMLDAGVLRHLTHRMSHRLTSSSCIDPLGLLMRAAAGAKRAAAGAKRAGSGAAGGTGGATAVRVRRDLSCIAPLLLIPAQLSPASHRGLTHFLAVARCFTSCGLSPHVLTFQTWQVIPRESGDCETQYTPATHSPHPSHTYYWLLGHRGCRGVGRRHGRRVGWSM